MKNPETMQLLLSYVNLQVPSSMPPGMPLPKHLKEGWMKVAGITEEIKELPPQTQKQNNKQSLKNLKQKHNNQNNDNHKVLEKKKPKIIFFYIFFILLYVL